MKSLTKIALASMLAVAPLVAAVGTASANTEMVPAARLVVPYWDVTAGKSTLLLLTNVSSWVTLKGTGTDGEVHIEWYDKSCSRSDVPVDLSPRDIDQIDLGLGTWNLPGTQGYADIDVRDVAVRTGTSLQYNVLLGTVIISDFTNDFALAYPAASSVGSAGPSANCTGGVGCPIVTRNANGSGKAVTWTGSFEPFPARVFVPMYVAEGGPLNTKSLLAIAAPANGNWAGGTIGEAPGQDVVSDDLLNPTILIKGNTEIWDGCEDEQSKPISAHYVLDSLGTLFGGIPPINLLNQAAWNTTANTQTSEPNCEQNRFPVADFASGEIAFIGWIDIPNQQNIGPNANSATGAVPQGDLGDQNARGMVGLLVQNVGATGIHQGDATRLAGDPAGGGDHSTVISGSRKGTYTQVDQVGHCDIDAAQLSANTPACFGTNNK